MRQNLGNRNIERKIKTLEDVKELRDRLKNIKEINNIIKRISLGCLKRILQISVRLFSNDIKYLENFLKNT